MNTELLANMKKEIEDITIEISNINKSINALKINDQRRLDANAAIPPGIACKVAFDKNGLIIKGIGLEVSDIPKLDIENINNLKISLDSKASIKDFETFKSEVSEMIKPTVDSISQICGTGIKVNYGSDGRIISSADLLPSDIPNLSIDKIDGLSDIISRMNNHFLTDHNDTKDISNTIINAGTYTKITVDKYGKITYGTMLDINDIPSVLLSRINIIESNMIGLASQKSVDSIIREVNKKLNANKSIIPGTYVKVKVDSNGLVVSGEKLTERDLPELSVNSIKGLEKLIISKADRADLDNLNDTVSNLMNSLNNIGDIAAIKSGLKSKADDKDLKILASDIKKIKTTIDTVVDTIPSDMILTQLNQMEHEISSLNGRINGIEQKMEILMKDLEDILNIQKSSSINN